MPQQPARRVLLRVIGLAAAAAAVGTAAHGCVRLSRSISLTRSSEPFEQDPAGGVHARILVAGDSTAVGTGASDPAASIAGRIGAAYRGVEIDNVGRDGARVREVSEQIATAEHDRYASVLIQAGGNDVIRFTPIDALAVHWRGALHAAASRADAIIVMPAGNVGTAPIFFPPLSWALTARARRAHQVARAAAREAGATFIDLFYERADDPFLRDPQRYYARDGLHPNAAGYGLWFDALRASGALSAALGSKAGARGQ